MACNWEQISPIKSLASVIDAVCVCVLGSGVGGA